MRIHILLTRIVLVLLLIGTGVVKSAFGGHIAGGTSGVEKIGEDSLKIFLNMYRDCTSQGLPDSIDLDVASSCGNTTFSVQRQSIDDITPVCESQCSACESNCSYTHGIEKHKYEGTVDVTGLAPCCNITLTFDNCCRDGSIENITSPISSRFYHKLTVDICQGEDFTTPRWNNAPLNGLCKDVPLISDQGTLDTYGDSVTYELVPPLEDGGNPVTWEQGYSTQAPLNYYGIQFGLPDAPFPSGFHLDEQTGELKYTPTSDDFQGVFSIRANQYKDGQLISQIRREMTVNHLNCQSANMPDIDPEPDQHQQICADSTLTFDVPVSDPEEDHMTMLRWNENPELDGAVYITDTGFAQATGQFSWTPDTGHARDKPYQIGYKARVDACNIYTSLSRSLYITVNPPPDITYEAAIQSCGDVYFEAEVTNIEGGDFHWEIEGVIDSQAASFTYNFNPGTYPYKLTVSGVGCTFTYQDTFEVPEYLTVDAGPDGLVCENESFTVSPQPQHYEGSLEEVTYDVNGYSFTDSVDVISAADTQLVITAEDSAGCKARDTVFLEVRALPESDVTDQYYCAGDDLGTVSTSLHPQYDIQWRSAAGQLLDAGPSFPLPDTGRFVLSASDHDLPECGDTDTFSVYQAEAVSGDLPDVQKCRGDTLQMGAFLSGTSYSWYHTGRGSIIETDSLLEYVADTSGDISLTIEKPFGPRTCTYHDTFTLEVTALPEADLAGPDNRCINGEPVVLPEHDTHETTWSGPGVEEGMWHPAEVGVGVHTLNYTLTDGSTGCSITDSVEAEAYALPELDFTVDPDSGEVPLTVTLTGSVADNGTAPVWDVRDADGVSDTIYGEVWDTEHVFDSAGSYSIVFSAADSVTGCRDTTSKSVMVTEEPNLLIMEDDPAIEVYPNPAEEEISIKSPGYTIERLILMSPDGRELLHKRPSSEAWVLRRSDIEAGVYILQVELHDGSLFSGRVVFR